MSLAIVSLAALAAYLAAGAALLLGAGWLAALLILTGTGSGAALALAGILILRTRTPPPAAWKRHGTVSESPM